MELTAIALGRMCLGTSIGPIAELAGALKARMAPSTALRANSPQNGGCGRKE